MTDKLRGNYTNTISVGGEITVTKELDEDKTSMDSSIRSNSSLAQTALTETNIIANGGSYTSDWTERTGPEMLIAISTDQDLDYYAEFSPDGINNDSSLPYTYDASGINPPRRLVIARKFWRIRIVNNSGSDLTYLRAQVSIGDFDPLSSKINATIDDQSDSVVSRAITTGKDPNNNYVNVSADGYVDAFGTTTALDNGEVFDSGIVDLSGYQSLKTEVASDQDGTIVGTWYDDAAGTNIIRTFTLPYSASETLSVTGTIILGKYLRYTFTNDSGVNQNRLYFNVRLSNVSMSGQILKVEQFVPTNVLTQLNRSILVGKKSSGVYGNVGINDANALEVSDFLFGVTRGEFSGFNIDTKFGYNPDIDIGSVPEDIWGPGGLYTGQPIHSASAETVEVFSSDNNDSSADTGARTLSISGLDENWEEQTETIILNGTTAVTSTGQWHRVFRANVLTAGSSGQNEGIITARHTTTTSNVFMQIPAGINNTILGAYTVPAGRTAYLLRLRISLARASGSAGSAVVSLRTRKEGGVYNSKRYETISSSFPLDFDLRGGIVLTEKTDIVLRVEDVSDNNSQVAGAFEYVLVDN